MRKTPGEYRPPNRKCPKRGCEDMTAAPSDKRCGRCGFVFITSMQTRLDRWHFLNAAQGEVPALVAELAAVFTASSPGVPLRGTDWFETFIGVPGDRLMKGGSSLGPLKCGVEEWARKFHLVEEGAAAKDGKVPEWVLGAVADTFCIWAGLGKPNGITNWLEPVMLPDIDYSLYRRHPRMPRLEPELHPDIDPSLYRRHVAGTVPDPEAPDPDYRRFEESLPIRTWNPLDGKSKKEMVEAITSEFNLKMESLDRIEKHAKHFGFIKAPPNFNADHFRWAAKYQVGAIDVDALAKRLGLKKRNLWDAIHATLASVGLTQRASRRGRPPVI